MINAPQFLSSVVKGIDSIMMCGQLCDDTNILWLVDLKYQYIHSLFENSNVKSNKIYVELD
jgi:hypothetical protein